MTLLVNVTVLLQKHYWTRFSPSFQFWLDFIILIHAKALGFVSVLNSNNFWNEGLDYRMILFILWSIMNVEYKQLLTEITAPHSPWSKTFLDDLNLIEMSNKHSYSNLGIQNEKVLW